jgi:hypothetical protein
MTPDDCFEMPLLCIAAAVFGVALGLLVPHHWFWAGFAFMEAVTMAWLSWEMAHAPMMEE